MYNLLIWSLKCHVFYLVQNILYIPVQYIRTIVYQLHQWKTATILQPPHVCPGTRRVQKGGYPMGVYQLRYGLAGLYRSYWKGNFHIMFTCLSNVLDILEIELKQKEVFLYVFFCWKFQTLLIPKSHLKKNKSLYIIITYFWEIIF